MLTKCMFSGSGGQGSALMAKLVWKGAAMLAPVPPALVSCGTMDSPNALTVAWTGILNSQPPKTYISIRPERFSHGIIRQSAV